MKTKSLKIVTTFLVFTVTIFVFCQSKRIQQSSTKEDTYSLPEIFPLQQLTGNTDSMLTSKYMNADTANFQRMESLWRSVCQINESMRKTIQKKRSEYPESKISNIDEVSQWLLELFSSWGGCYSARYYKQVEDGFLIKGFRGPFYWQGSFCRDIMWRMFLVSHDHNILEIKSWTIDNICPRVSFEIHFPEFENAEVRYPEIPDYSINSFLSKNVRYPLMALESGIQGRVLVSFIVETDGSITDIEIVRSVDRHLDAGAIRSIRRTDGQWIPGTKNGEKTPMEIKVEFDFGWR